MVDLRCLGSSPERLFLTPKSRVFGRFSQGGSERETGSIRSEEISGVDLEVPGLDHGIPRFRVFSPEFTCSHFLYNVTFLRKFRRTRVLECASEFIAVTIPAIGSTFYVN